MPSPDSSSTLNARSRRTRQAILAAARELLEHEGFEALTIAAVAERAGVTRRAVYLHFASRAEIVGALFDQVAETEGLRASTDRVWAAPDAGAALDLWAAHLAHYHPRVIAVDRAVERVRETDADAANHHARVRSEKLANCRRLAEWLNREGRLASPWTVATATQMLCALISSDLIASLLEDGWSERRIAMNLGALLRATFDARASAQEPTRKR